MWLTLTKKKFKKGKYGIPLRLTQVLFYLTLYYYDNKQSTFEIKSFNKNINSNSIVIIMVIVLCHCKTAFLIQLSLYKLSDN